MIHGPVPIEGLMMGQRIAKDISAGQTCRATGRKFGVSPSTAIRLGAAVREGKSLEPRRQGRRAGQGKLAPYTGLLLEAVKAKPDTTLRELAEMLDARHGIKVSLPSIWRVLKMAGLTYKTYGPVRSRLPHLIQSDDSQIIRSSSSSAYESRNCRQCHPSGSPST